MILSRFQGELKDKPIGFVVTIDAFVEQFPHMSTYTIIKKATSRW